jgi:hypothetical protein
MLIRLLDTVEEAAVNDRSKLGDGQPWTCSILIHGSSNGRLS